MKIAIEFKTLGRTPEDALLEAMPDADIYGTKFPSWGGREGVLAVEVARLNDGSLAYPEVIRALEETFVRL
jgi:hypothetical protein